MRTREIVLLRAGGMTIGQVSAMIVTESALYGIFALVIGLAAGLLLEYKFYDMIIVETYCIPWALPWSIVAVSCAVTIAAVMLSAISPVRRIKRLAVTESISFE